VPVLNVIATVKSGLVIAERAAVGLYGRIVIVKENVIASVPTRTVTVLVNVQGLVPRMSAASEIVSALASIQQVNIHIQHKIPILLNIKRIVVHYTYIIIFIGKGRK
jgi:hypothetical protein